MTMFTIEMMKKDHIIMTIDFDVDENDEDDKGQ